jgi:hypothetical protein
MAESADKQAVLERVGELSAAQMELLTLPEL